MELKAFLEIQDFSEREDIEVKHSAIGSIVFSESRFVTLNNMLREDQFNWLEFYSRVESEVLIDAGPERIHALLEKIYHQLPKILSVKNSKKVKFS